MYISDDLRAVFVHEIMQEQCSRREAQSEVNDDRNNLTSYNRAFAFVIGKILPLSRPISVSLNVKYVL